MQYAPSAAELNTLLALVRGGTLAQAAARIGADASTVFRTVQRVEKQGGQRLFERGRQGYLPTEAMTALAGHAERIEAELEAAGALLQGPRGEVTGRVRLTTTDSVLRGLVLPALPPLLAAHPRLQLELHAGNELLSLTRRDADLALRATPKPPQHLVGRHLGAIRFVVCGAKGAAKGRKAMPLEARDWIAPDEALPEHPTVRWRRRQLPKVEPRHLVDGIVALADAVIAGLGVGIVPQFMLDAEPRLVALSPPLDGCESKLWLLAHPESRHLRRIAAVYAHLAEQIRLS
ncbi:MAG TPA: LysR family transcriptional regulator [Ramlibacter sp.]|nr:LysR family transcriptional regulator [Ramlibacter sp.]